MSLIVLHGLFAVINSYFSLSLYQSKLKDFHYKDSLMKPKYSVGFALSLMLFLGLFLSITPIVQAHSDSYASKLPSSLNPSDVQPCITVRQVHIEGVALFNLIELKRINEWKRLIEGKCVNDSALIDYAELITSELEQAGYATSYLFYPEQSFSFGVLKATLVAGRVANITYQDTAHGDRSLSNAFPVTNGQVFNLRLVEQGLYNLQNTSLIPYNIYLVPDDNETQLIVERTKERAFKGLFSIESLKLDGSLNNSVGNTFMLANPLLLNDFFYTDISHDFTKETNNKGINSNAISVGFFYSLPYQYWLFSTYGGYQESQSKNSIDETVLLLEQRSRILSLDAKYIIRRMQNSLTTLSFGSQVQTLDTFLSHQRLKTQGRLASYVMLGLEHQIDFSQGHLTLSLNYKQGTDWFGANARQITKLDKPQIYQLSIATQRSALWFKQPIYHQHKMEVQLSRSKLDNLLEQGILIGKFGLSGFGNSEDDFNMGDNNLMLKNELGWVTPWKGTQLYTSLDLGTTSNDRAGFWHENLLLGVRAGTRGWLESVAYHFFVESPVWKTESMRKNQFSGGVELSFGY